MDGFTVTDDTDAEFWTAFQEFGGVQAVGYPISTRFIWDGFTTQVMQKSVFQWRPDTLSVSFVNVFDDLHRLGFDGALAHRLVPECESFDESGLTIGQISARRIALLDAEPKLRGAYDAVQNPLLRYGLPTSHVRDFDGLRTIRLQRTVLQLWTRDFPWATAGTVTIANGGDLARQLGMFPLDAMIPMPEQDEFTQLKSASTRVSYGELVDNPEEFIGTQVWLRDRFFETRETTESGDPDLRYALVYLDNNQ